SWFDMHPSQRTTLRSRLEDHAVHMLYDPDEKAAVANLENPIESSEAGSRSFAKTPPGLAWQLVRSAIRNSGQLDPSRVRFGRWLFPTSIASEYLVDFSVVPSIAHDAIVCTPVAGPGHAPRTVEGAAVAASQPELLFLQQRPATETAPPPMGPLSDEELR